MTTAEMRLLKQELEFKKNLTLVATPDNNVRLKGPDVMVLMKKYISEMKAYMEGGSKRPVAAVRAPAPATTPPSVSAQQQLMNQRYGLNRRTPAPAPTPTPALAAPAVAAVAAAPPSPAAIAAEIAKLPVVVLASGNWKGDGEKYEVTLQAQASGLPFDDAKKSASVVAEIRDGRLYLTEADETFVMEKF